MPKRKSEIASLKNLGPRCEADLNAVGIYTLDELKSLGPEAAFRKVWLGRLTRGETTKTLNAMYIYALHGAIHDMSCLELSEEDKSRYKAFARSMRTT